MSADTSKFVPPLTRPLHVRIAWAVVWALLGLGIGIAAGYARPRIAGHIHYEMIVAWFVLITLNLVLIARLYRAPMRQFSVDLILWTTLLWVGFWLGIDGMMLWEGKASGASGVGFLGFAIIHWVGAVLVGHALIGSARLQWPLRHGPYCPRCRYCLIGVAAHRCPECGRGFTPEELGITEADLSPDAPKDPADV